MMKNFLARNYVSSLFGVQLSLVCSENKLTVEIWIKWYIYNFTISFAVYHLQTIHASKSKFKNTEKQLIFVTEGPGWKECFLTQNTQAIMIG